MIELALGIPGLKLVAVKVFGPDHAYTKSELLGVLSVIVLPLHTGLFVVIIGIAGVGLTSTSMLVAGDLQLLMVTVTRYLPVATVRTFGIEGSGVVEL